MKAIISLCLISFLFAYKRYAQREPIDTNLYIKSDTCVLYGNTYKIVLPKTYTRSIIPRFYKEQLVFTTKNGKVLNIKVDHYLIGRNIKGQVLNLCSASENVGQNNLFSIDIDEKAYIKEVTIIDEKGIKRKNSTPEFYILRIK